MDRKEEIEKVVDLLEKKYDLYIRLRDSMVSLKKCIINGQTPEMESLIHKRDRHIKKINAVDKQISENRELLSQLFQDNENSDGYGIKIKLGKLRGIIKEISGIQKECLSCGRSQIISLKQEISAVRRQVQAFKGYSPHPPSHSRFVDTVR